MNSEEVREVSVLKNGKTPDPDVIHPIPGYDKEIYVKPTVKNPNIIVGEFTYIADSEFESHVTHLYEWNGDKHSILCVLHSVRNKKTAGRLAASSGGMLFYVQCRLFSERLRALISSSKKSIRLFMSSVWVVRRVIS